ncbi:MAG: hypothetical protein OEY52_08905 [Gammaproteobacteria bacterium]|nr:hypothetical protein [Gammaproteobacteria bacterium]
MNTRIWVSLVTVSFLLAFLAGYNVSVKTGVEPGYFEAPEAGGYGAGAEKKAPAGISEELQDYYKDLSE